MKTNIFEIFRITSLRLNRYIDDVICSDRKAKDSMNIAIKVKNYSKRKTIYYNSISKIKKLINEYKLARYRSNRKNLVKKIVDFLDKYYRVANLEGVPTMDANTFNNFMIFLTILKLDDAANILNEELSIWNIKYWKKNSSDESIKNLINKMSVETFRLAIGNNNDILNNMKENITDFSIKFWKNYQISNIMTEKSILDINYNNFAKIMKQNIYDLNSSNILENLKDHMEMLEGYNNCLLKIIKNSDDETKIQECLNFKKDIDKERTKCIDTMSNLITCTREDTDTVLVANKDNDITNIHN